MTLPLRLGRTEGRRPNHLSRVHMPGLPALVFVWGLMLVALSIVWPRYGFFALGGLPQVTPFTLMAILSWLLLPCLLVLDPVMRNRFGFAIWSNSLVLSLVGAWIVWRFLTSALGEDPGSSLFETAREVVYLTPILFMTILISTMPSGKLWISRTMVVSALLVLLLAALESALKRSVVDILGLRFAIDAQSAVNVTEVTLRAGLVRIKSVFSHPIVFGQFLAFIFPIAVWSLFKERSGLMRLLSLTVVALIPWAVVITGSRAAIVGLAVAVFTFVLIYAVHRLRQNLHTGVLVILGVLLISTITFAAVSGQILDLISGRNSVESTSTIYREAMISKGLDEISYSPIFGFGDGRAAYHAGFVGRNNILTIDSLYLSTLLNNGWVGLAIFVSVWIFYARSALLSVLTNKKFQIEAAMIAGVISLFFTFSIVTISDNITLLFIAIALCGGAISGNLLSRGRSNRALRGRLEI
jgi:hypothetical protein